MIKFKFLNEHEKNLMKEYMEKVRSYTREEARKIIERRLREITNIPTYSDRYPLKDFDGQYETFCLGIADTDINPITFDECLSQIVEDLRTNLGLKYAAKNFSETFSAEIYLDTNITERRVM